tara:strand:+ start:1237 stop:1701 length:465 start_codon:yes stop_codon:yes gene_type:complete
MSDLNFCIENLHKPRITEIAEYLLRDTEFEYDFFEPPTFDTYMIQIKLKDDLILSINYYPIEISDDVPFLFLQFHCLIKELENSPSSELLAQISEANNGSELSSFYADENKLFLKSVFIDDSEQELDISKISFLLGIFHSNLLEHKDMLTSLGS